MLNMPCVFQLVNSINLSFIQQKFIEYPPNEKHICGIVSGGQFAAVFKLVNSEYIAKGAAWSSTAIMALILWNSA